MHPRRRPRPVAHQHPVRDGHRRRHVRAPVGLGDRRPLRPGHGRWPSARPTTSIRTSPWRWPRGSGSSSRLEACAARPTSGPGWRPRTRSWRSRPSGVDDRASARRIVMIPRPANPLIVALDVSEQRRAEELAGMLAGRVGMLKVGLELFTAEGPRGIEAVARHAPVFLDVKLHDIPTTVRRAAVNAGRLGATLLTVHALGGPEMVEGAVAGVKEGAEDAGREPPGVVAVTIL